MIGIFKLAATVALTCLSLLGPVQSSYAEEEVDWSFEMISKVRARAEAGSAMARALLARLHVCGEAELEFAKAREWWEQAAAQGDAGAQYNLGLMYYKGAWQESKGRDDAMAGELWEKATAQEHAGLAERNTAIHATRPLRFCLFVRSVHPVHFTVVLDPVCCLSVGARLPSEFQKTCSFTHESFLLCR